MKGHSDVKMKWCTWKYGDKRANIFYRLRYKRWTSNSLFYRDHGDEQFVFILFCSCQRTEQPIKWSLAANTNVLVTVV